MCRCRKGVCNYYLSKLALLLTINASYLICGIILYVGKTEFYGGTVSYETEQWGTGAILDI